METRRRVVFCGDSVVLASVRASLEKCPRLQVVSVPASPATTAKELDVLSPAVVLLDLSMVTMEFAFALLREWPDLLLIGLDSGGDKLLVLSGRQARTLTTEDLIKLTDSRVAL